ncbi:MAG: hypothetical protein EOM92_13550 [Gammaproteobacteria bacterium]|nr:hypothetical protein [Gammaproteobacteria bacterium]
MIRRGRRVLLGGALLAAILARWVVLQDETPLAALPAAARAAWRPSVPWLPPTPRTRLLQAQAAAPGDPAAVEAAWLAAHRAQPHDPDPLFRLAEGRRLRGDLATADQLVAAAVRLAPAYGRTHRRAAGYWAARGDLAALLQHASRAMILDPAARDTFFPVLQDLLAHPAGRTALAGYARARPAWWLDFFRHVARQGSRPALDALYALHRQQAAPLLSPGERTAYVNRLLRDGDATRAYLHWMGGLSAAERAQLGLLFNGHFDLPLDNQPFGWVVKTPAPFRVRTGTTAGARGGALELRFRQFTMRFAHLRQRLLLPPGDYQLQGRVRLDALQSPAGLQWRLECAAGSPPDAGRVLATGAPLVGTAPWRDFVLPFAVPADCPQQVLKLVSAGTRPFEYRLEGGLWFDEFAVRRAAAAPGEGAPPAVR